MRTLVVVPMKDVAVSKTRLAWAMPARERERMAFALFRSSLNFFGVQYPNFKRLVVTSSARIATHSKRCGASVLRESEPGGLNAAVDCALTWAIAQGFDRLLIVPADIPVWLRGEVDELLCDGVTTPVVIARAHDGGTNAMLLDLARVRRFQFCYGPQSARLHAEAAEAAALGVSTRSLPFLSHDIDTVDDCLVFGEKLAALTHAE